MFQPVVHTLPSCFITMLCLAPAAIALAPACTSDGGTPLMVTMGWRSVGWCAEDRARGCTCACEVLGCVRVWCRRLAYKDPHYRPQQGILSTQLTIHSLTYTLTYAYACAGIQNLTRPPSPHPNSHPNSYASRHPRPDLTLQPSRSPSSSESPIYSPVHLHIRIYACIRMPKPSTQTPTL